MANECRQRVETRLQEPARDTKTRATDGEEHNEASDDIEALLEGVFMELQDYDEERAQQQRVIE